jgi:periplasmic protein TonB
MKKILIICFTVFACTLNAQEKTVTKNELPEYPGGKVELDAFIQKNLKFPAEYSNNSNFKECVVYVKFTVDTSGKILNPLINKGCFGFDQCDKEALRIVSLMPLWKPAKSEGNPVKRSYNLPVTFKKS